MVQRRQAFRIILVHDEHARKLIPGRHGIGLYLRSCLKLGRGRHQLAVVSQVTPEGHPQFETTRVRRGGCLQLLQNLRRLARQTIGIGECQSILRGG